MIRSNSEQEQAAVDANMPYVAMLCTRGDNWTWYVDAVFRTDLEAEGWYKRQTGSARVYKVGRGKATIFFAK